MCDLLRDERGASGGGGIVRLRVRDMDVRGLVLCVGIGAAASHCEMCMRVVGGAVGVVCGRWEELTSA